jgi:hypothetical protein
LGVTPIERASTLVGCLLRLRLRYRLNRKPVEMADTDAAQRWDSFA